MEDHREEAGYERLFREVFERSANAMVLVDDTGTYVDANPAALNLLRYAKDELLGRKLPDVADPEDRPAVERDVAAFADPDDRVPDHGIRTFVTGDGRRLRLHFCRRMHVLPGLHLGVYVNPVEEPLTVEPRRETVRPSPREVEVIGLLALGATGEEIAERLVLSPATVRTHIRNAMEKLGASTRAHLIAIAARERLISL